MKSTIVYFDLKVCSGGCLLVMVLMLFVYSCALQILLTGKSVQKRQERETKENQRQKMKKLFQTLNDPDQIHP